MKQSNSEATASHLGEAEKKLGRAVNLLNDSYFDDAARNAHYSMYHASKALLTLKGVEPKTHHGVISEIQRLYVKPGELEQEYAASLARDLQVRIRTDYETMVEVTKEMAKESVNDAKEFLKKVKTIIEE